MTPTKVLIVDDDLNIQELLRLYFVKDGFNVYTEGHGDRAEAAVLSCQPDVAVLDLMLPGKNGFDILRDLRKRSDVPVSMLTARGETLDKVVGLELGADDYLEKPFEPKELLARDKAVLRRTRAPAGRLFEAGQLPERLRLNHLIVDLARYSVYLDGREVEFPPKELELLHFMVLNRNRVFTREQILDNIWGHDFFGDTRTVDVHIKRIREKLDTIEHPEWNLKTVWGVGYKFEASEDAG